MSKINTKAGNNVGSINSHKDNELKAVYELLRKQSLTATQVAVMLNIYRPNLSRRKRTLEKADKLRQIKKVICPVTKHPAWQLTCDPDLFPPKQPTLFDGIGGVEL